MGKLKTMFSYSERYFQKCASEKEIQLRDTAQNDAKFLIFTKSEFGTITDVAKRKTENKTTQFDIRSGIVFPFILGLTTS